MGFLPVNVQLSMPFHSQLMVMYGTDRQTTAVNALWIRRMGRGYVLGRVQ